MREEFHSLVLPFSVRSTLEVSKPHEGSIILVLSFLVLQTLISLSNGIEKGTQV